jgi:hypothetical protein
MSDGSTRKFASKKKRDNFERVARAVKHGWRKPKIGMKEMQRRK